MRILLEFLGLKLSYGFINYCVEISSIDEFLNLSMINNIATIIALGK